MAFIISELGINHNGDLSLAKKMITMAKGCGVSAIKLQKRTIETVYTNKFLKSPRESPFGNDQESQKRALEFSKDDYDAINEHCVKLNIPWFASAWDLESLKFLDQFDLKFNKIASPMLTNGGILLQVANRKKMTFISTGMSTIEDIDVAVEIFINAECPFIIMHCVSVYPCPDHLLNLRTIPFLKNKYKRMIGYSGHEVGVMPSVMAVVLGAQVVERHITLDRAMYGSDQAASLEPQGLKRLVEYIRQAELARGEQDFIVWPEEEENAKKLRYWN
ncbi:MAG: N-acetylneuraminate synthase [Desulfobacteraceae bacterium]|nr:MAG: N-acetylneuraminate synthase [Desulfobacteraceae bacterium]